MPFDFNAPKMLWLLNISILSVSYEGHSRNTQWALNLISTFLLEIQLSHVAIYSEMYFQNSKIVFHHINYIHIVSNYEQLFFFVFFFCFLFFISEMYYCYVHVQQYNMCERIIDEEFEDIKGVIRSRKTKRDRQYNSQ
jgi:hypothetical protein